ncbi:Sulfur carrier protein ThiS [Marinomonas gallaica]|uniref:Sulfur carrier protein ThiS n=2 Tax=Marinomonas gallaica TaxID=1806667 RepID=A0A1C3JTU3_9GAMM|nr:Sulfur carrier protein ThiS [Marinomonas gallaica]SBT21598.1 Sulfur carrier protein ThiS [Marinomonas gallaica]
MLMQLYVNDELVQSEHSHLSTLIDELVSSEQRVAVAVNQQVVPRSQWSECLLNDNDRIDIFESIAGG